jgi:hypothetical protein
MGALCGDRRAFHLMVIKSAQRSSTINFNNIFYCFPSGTIEVEVEGMHRTGIVHEGGILLFGMDDKAVNVSKLGLPNGKMIPASKYGNVKIQF